MVPDNSTGIPRAPAYSGGGYGSTWLRVPDSHRLRSAFPDGSARSVWPIAPLLLPRHVPCDTAGLGSSPFARRYWGNRCYFLFLQVLRCFSSLRSPPHSRMTESLPPGCPIRTSAGQCVFAARRSFSQLVTSFFASESQGILHAPLSFR